MSRGGGVAERVRWIGEALYELTGRRPLVERRGGDRFRITVRVAAQPDRVVTREVLRVLGAGDRYGHGSTARWERLWTEVGPPPGEEGER